MDIKDVIEKEKIIVIVRGVKEDKLISLAEAMYKGGIRLLELTYSADGKISDEDTAKNINALVKHFEGRMHIGAGTVLTEKQVELTFKAGGEFIISPDTSLGVIKKTKELGLVSIPGAFTPTEIQTAYKAGADYVKLFPVSNLGIEYINAVKAPLSHIKFIAVGGLNENNLSDFLKIGVVGFGIGSNIVNKKFIEGNDWSAISELAKKFTSRICK